MPKLPSDVLAFILAALCVVGIIVLAVLGQPIPDVLTTVALFSAGIGGGASLPRLSAGTTTPPPAPVGIIQ